MRINSFIKVTIIIIIVLLFYTTGFAKKKTANFTWDPVSEIDWDGAPDSIVNDADAYYIFDKVTIDERKLDKDKIYITVYRRIRIKNNEGRSFADVEAMYMNKDSKLTLVDARTILRSGKIINLEKDNIFEREVVRQKKYKFIQKYFSLPGVTDDCIIEYVLKYKLEDRVPRWEIQKEIPQLSATFNWKFHSPKLSAYYYELISLLGPGYDYSAPNYLLLNGEDKMTVTNIPDDGKPTELLLSFDYLDPYEDEPFGFPDPVVRTSLYLYYGTATSSQDYWFSWASHLGSAVEDYCEKNDKVLKVIDSFGPMATKDEKIEKAFNWIQENIQNYSYFDLKDPKKPDKEVKRKKINNLNDIIKRGYASEWGISVLFYHMLKEMGLKSSVAYAVSRENDFFIKKAKFWQFDEILVSVEVDSNVFKYYTPGIPFATMDFVPWYIEGVDILQLNSLRRFKSIPFSMPTVTNYIQSYSYSINEDMEVEGKFSGRYTGHEANRLRMATFDVTDDERLNTVRENIEESFVNAEIDSIITSGFEDVNERVGIDCNLKFPALSEQGNRLLLKPFDYFESSANLFTAEERVGHILFRYPFTARESAQITIPDGWELEGLPSDTTYENEVGQHIHKFSQVGNLLSIQKLYVMKAPFWRASDYAQVKKFFETNLNIKETIIVLKRSAP